MKLSVFIAAALAASAEAVIFESRQQGIPDVSDCGLDAFEGRPAEALLFCSNILKSKTAIRTVTVSTISTTTVTKKTTTTVYPSSSRRSSATPKPTPTSTSKPTPTPSTSSKSSAQVPASSSPAAPSSPSFSPVQPSSTLVTSTLISSPSPTPTSAPGCGIAAYVNAIPAYYFEPSGTKNTFAACSALCKADTKCKSFAYGEANCMLFDVDAASNTNYNPMSPYTFYNAGCTVELPYRKRQLDITLGLPGGIDISLGLGGPSEISSACSCLITRGPADTTRTTTTTTSKSVKTTTTTTTVTRTASSNGGSAGSSGEEAR